jgi:hypothetical protein
MSADTFKALALMLANAVVIGYGSRFGKMAARAARLVAIIQFTAIPDALNLKFVLYVATLSGLRKSVMKPMS